MEAMKRWGLLIGLVALAVPLTACTGSDDGPASDDALAEAIDVIPASIQGFEFTDVGAIERRLGVDDLNGRLSTDELQEYSNAFLDAGEPTSTMLGQGGSALVAPGDMVENRYDWNGVNVDWEAQAYDLQAQVVAEIRRFDDDVDLDAMVSDLKRFGYESSDEHGTTVLEVGQDSADGSDALHTVDGVSLDEDVLGSPLVVLPDSHLVVTANIVGGANEERTIAAFTDDDESLADSGALDDLIATDHSEFVMASLDSSQCATRSKPDPGVIRPKQAEEQAARLDSLETPDSYAIAVGADGESATARLRFADEDDASDDAGPREDLLADGQYAVSGDEYTGDFSADDVSVDGDVETIDLALKGHTAQLQGSLFLEQPYAACPVDG